MDDATPPHPRHHTIAQLTAAIAQVEETAKQWRQALEQHLAQGRNANRCRGQLRRTEAQLALLRQSRDHILAEVPQFVAAQKAPKEC
jgi:hypothetical protein